MARKQCPTCGKFLSNNVAALRERVSFLEREVKRLEDENTILRSRGLWKRLRNKD